MSFTEKVQRVRNFVRNIKGKLRTDPDAFLSHVSGVIHVGANTGQEREVYDGLGLKVIWIEPIPKVFEKLKNNLTGFPGQRCFQYLVTDSDEKEYTFNIASNEGASSSILELSDHKDIWPNIDYVDKITLKSITLKSLYEREVIDDASYQALVMDTQGSELLVLIGAIPKIKNFKYIKTEVPDFDSYLGCCQLKDITAFMDQYGFKEISRTKFASHPNGGSYFDVVYKKT